MFLRGIFNGDLFSIRSATIPMARPEIKNDRIERLPLVKTEKNNKLMEAESILRRSAYKNTTIKTGTAFFDDSDMLSEYYLTVIYDKRSGAPLLTSRYYFNKQIIDRTLRGDDDKTPELMQGADKEIFEFHEGDLFLADRLSGNISNAVYRRCRAYIFLLYYSELLKYNRGRKFIIMARKERSEKLLKKYLQLGFEKVGLTKHKNKEHWILISDFKQSYSRLRGSVWLNLILIFRGSLFRI